MRVGFIGLGKMGRPMAGHILRNGHELFVHNRSQNVVEQLVREGATARATPAAIARSCDLVLTCLPTPASVESVYFGVDGLISDVPHRPVMIDCSTVSPQLSRRQHAASADAGAHFLDAPVSGGTEGAEQGTLTTMVGGDDSAFHIARPILECFSAEVHYAGGSGSGTVIKLINQLLVGITAAAVAEAFVFGVKAGADPTTAFEVISTSYGASTILKRNVPRILDRDFEAAGPIDLVLKDLELITEVGNELDVRLLLGKMAETLFRESRSLGFGHEDMAALVKNAERIAGVEVQGRSTP